MTGPLLAAHGLSVRRGRREVLHAVDLAVGAGEVVAVLGPNGTGKSTLLAALAGALPPHQGWVERTGPVATVLQTPGLAARTACANVELALQWWGEPRRGRRAKALAALASMQASALGSRSAAELSGGERRRVHLARAVAVAAPVTLLDEPFDGLDPITHVDLRDDTVAALRRVGGAVLIVLHDRADAWAVADRVVVLLDGRIVADAAPRALLASPPTAEVARFLGYDGEIRTAAGLVMTRRAGVVVDAGADLRGTVRRVVPGEDGAGLLVDTPTGSLWATDTRSASVTGDTVGLDIRHSVTFE